jgi:bacteriorhodopsin
MAGNQALNVNGHVVNGRSSDIHITVRGSDWYWTVCAIMTVATIAFIGHSFTKPRTHRIFHYITSSITMVAAIAYFSMAANLGWTPIDVEFRRSNPRVAGVNREIFYVRYIDWVITTPLLLMDLLLTAGMPWPTVMWVILVDLVMIITGLVGALVKSSYKWGYFTFGCAALLYIVYQLAWEARIHANHIGSDVGRTFLSCGTLTLVLWCVYPIAWGVCEGANIISPDSEAIFYGILDLLAKPVFGALLLWGHRNIDPARLGLRLRDVTDHPGEHSGTKGHEKLPRDSHHTATGAAPVDGYDGTSTAPRV